MKNHCRHNRTVADSIRWTLALLLAMTLFVAAAERSSADDRLELNLSEQLSDLDDISETKTSDKPDAKAGQSGKFDPSEKSGAESDDDGDVGEGDEELDKDDDGMSNRQSLPEVSGGRFRLPALTAASIATDDIGNGRLPEGFRADETRPLQGLPESGSQRGQAWSWSVANWAAPNTYSYPRYFEDRMLERHGHERWGHFQPVASGARFFATIPMLPYLMAIQEPCDCEYTLGYFRSGSCAPMTYQRPPWNRKAIIAESVAVAAGILIFP